MAVSGAEDANPHRHPVLRAVWRWKYVLLLVAMIVAALVQPIAAQRVGAGEILHDLVTLTPLLIMFLVVFTRHWERLIAFTAAGIVLVTLGAHHLIQGTEGTYARLTHDAVATASMVFAVVVILRNIFEQKLVHVDDVIGAICGYMLAGVAWANLYAFIGVVVPDAFAVSPDLKAQMSDWQTGLVVYRYFSFISLATVGFGDMTPQQPLAMTLVWMEALFGQFYVAIVVAQLVAARLTQFAAEKAGNHNGSSSGSASSREPSSTHQAGRSRIP